MINTFLKDKTLLTKLTELKLILNHLKKYTLDTFNQQRSLMCKFRPISNTQVSSNAAPAPDPWTLNCAPDQMFVSHQKSMIVPSTDLILVNSL